MTTEDREQENDSEIEYAVFCAHGGMHCAVMNAELGRDYLPLADRVEPRGAPHRLSQRTVTFGPWITANLENLALSERTERK